jgi:hypothetical protein
MLEYSTIPISQLAKARSDRISLLIAFLFTCGKDAISRSDCGKETSEKTLAA